MTAEFRGTQVDDYLTLAGRLVDGDGLGAFEVAGSVAAWNGNLMADWIDDETIAPAVRAAQVLNEAVRHAAGRVR
jgi:hypothetical protein